MQNHSLKTLNMRAIILLTMLFALASPLHAQAGDINPEIANCEEITDPATQTQVDFCTAHIGCKLVMGIQKACTKAKTFLNNLKNLTFGKNKIDSSDVFDAAAPSTAGDAGFNNISKSIKTGYDKQPKKEIDSGKSENGVNWVYEGGMKNGVRDGTGVLITDTGTVFRGDFIAGRQAGMGELYNDKSIKAGVMANAKMEGVGVERFANGRRYEGDYKADKFDGQGAMTWPRGDKYEGGFKDGNKNGQGTEKYYDGDQYTGGWLNNQRSGTGTFKWANGDTYSGDYVANKRQGQGKLVLKNGISSAGEYRDGKLINGTQINSDGTRLNFANGVVVKTPQQIAADIAAQYDQRINAASAQCNSSENSCGIKCLALTALTIFARTGDVNETLQCNQGCNEEKSSCEQQVSAIGKEKLQAVAEANAPKQPAQIVLASSSGSRSAGVSSRICDKQCGMIVAETKCKHVRSNNEASLQCQMKNGIMLEDTPELCAQARSLSGCVMKADYVQTKFEMRKSTHNSVCERNVEKINNVMRNIEIYGMTNDSFIKDTQWFYTKLFEPCIGSSERAASLYKSAMDEYNKIRQYCASPHPSHECTQWGASGYTSHNMEWYQNWKAEVDRALSDPNYSAELGPVKVSGGGDPAEAACFVSLKTIERQYEAASANIPANSVVVLSEATMWKIAQFTAKVKAQCPQSRQYASEVASLLKTYQETKRACSASASNPPCVPRLPGKAPVYEPQTIEKPLPQLKDQPKVSCGKPPSASAIQCLKERCAPDELRPGADGCYFCGTRDTGRFWVVCPDGRGAAQ